MMDIAQVAIVALPSFAAGALGMAFLHTRMAPSCEDRVNAPGDDAFTIARLTEDLERMGRHKAFYYDLYKMLNASNKRLRAENRDLRTDMAAKAKRLSDAGLQSAGGTDVAL